jgi:uncharacterized protein YjiS (DUF1127 family)
MATKAATDMKFTAGFTAPAGSALAALATPAWRLAGALGRRRELRRLIDCDDHVLADLGLTRDDLRRALSKPFWRDPTAGMARSAR